MTAGALKNGFSTEHARSTAPRASRSATGLFKNYESGAYGYIGFAKALEVSCNTFFYRVGYHFWQKYGTDVADVKAKDPLVADGQEVRLRQDDRDRPPRRGHRPHRRPEVEASPTGSP